MFKGLEGNIVKYNLYKIFTKRVFLPLIAIYLVEVGQLSLVQIGLIASVTAVASFILEIPTGYIADRWGHKKALILGATLTTFSTLFYIFMPNFIGALLASVIFFTGGTFTSGALQAFMHETLKALGRAGEYSKIMGRGQSYGLLGNVILISLVPLTYEIDKTWPFILGFVCLFISLLLVLSLKLPPRHEIREHKTPPFLALKETFQSLPKLYLFSIFLIFGVVSATLDQSTIFRELVFKSVNIPVPYFGFILAFGSLTAAVAGWYIHLLNKLKPFYFYLLDVVYVAFGFLLAGLSMNPILTILAFTLFPTYDRNRSIVIEHQLFEQFPNLKHKSTLISSLNFFALANNIWVAPLLTYAVHVFGISLGHAYFGFVFAPLILILFILKKYLFKNS